LNAEYLYCFRIKSVNNGEKIEMKKVLVGALLILAQQSMGADPGESIGLQILSEEDIRLETPEWDPPRLDSVSLGSSSSLTLFASSVLQGNETDLARDLWEIKFSDNGVAAVSVLNDDGEDVVRFDMLGEDMTQWMVKISPEGDTLWKCELEGTDDFDNNIRAIPLSDGGYFLVSHPDCWGSSCHLFRISSGGNLLWDRGLSTTYLLEVEESETKPHVISMRMTARGDLLVCGYVQQWITSSDAMYVALLDGDTGESRWKAITYVLGEASAGDIVETSSGRIVAVGATAESTHPTPEQDFVNIWSDERHPFAAVLDPDGTLRGSVVYYSTEVDEFNGIIETDPESEELLILASPSYHEPAGRILIRAHVETEGN